jgi:hypothetical protein
MIQKAENPIMARSELNSILIKDALLQPEYGTIRTTSALFGISRTVIFRLLAEGQISAIHYKQAGTCKGVRLVNLQSVRDHLQSFATGK